MLRLQPTADATAIVETQTYKATPYYHASILWVGANGLLRGIERSWKSPEAAREWIRLKFEEAGHACPTITCA